MATPDFVLSLREKIGNDPLWLSGITAVVLRGDEVLLVRRADNGAWTPVTGIIDPGEPERIRADLLAKGQHEVRGRHASSLGDPGPHA